jgi:pSer/pThr/pTyr-binding forkhead associated (FHA) protein
VPIRSELVVGRETGGRGLTLSADLYLGRSHFVIRTQAEDCLLEDLNSRNGVAVNDPKNRVRSRVLRDGDIIFAGDHVFLFLSQGGVPG